ncbi:MAG TPA: type II secretion system protein GspF [Aeromonadales bacterium]|nr:type II secretion system protein GspF [Aeromonadales bacterium]
MAAFEYLALTDNGRRQKGVLEADTARQVRSQLRDKSLTPLEVYPVVRKDKTQKNRFKLGGSIKTSDLALVTRQLATLVEAAIPVEESLKAVSEQVERPKIKSMLLAIRARVVEGHTLADALAEFPQAFDHLFRSMVAAGEKSGHLGPVLIRLADFIESRQQLKSKIRIAMIYPITLIVVALTVVIFLLAYVVPDIVKQFDDLGGELPTLTRAMLSISDFIQNYGVFVMAIVVGLIAFWRWYLSDEERLKDYHRFLLTLPVVGKVIRGLNSARFARTLAILTSSGIPVLEGMRISGQVLTNLDMRESVKEAAIRVSEGASLKQSLKETGQFPPMMLHMIASGEDSGELEAMLEKTANSQELEFENTSTIALALFEPFIIIVMGMMILLIVLAILLPVFGLNDLITT